MPFPKPADGDLFQVNERVKLGCGCTVSVTVVSKAVIGQVSKDDLCGRDLCLTTKLSRAMNDTPVLRYVGSEGSDHHFVDLDDGDDR